MTRSPLWVAIVALWSSACGGGVAFRPLEIEIRGLSARAEVLVFKIVPGSEAVPCGRMDPAQIAAIPADIEQRWVRSAEQPRRFELPEIEAEGMTLLAHAEDGAGQPIQQLCRFVSYEEIGDLESGLLILTLSRRTSET